MDIINFILLYNIIYTILTYYNEIYLAFNIHNMILYQYTNIMVIDFLIIDYQNSEPFI